MGKDSIKSGLAVALAAFAVYATTLANGFVWDDNFVILSNRSLSGPALSLFSSIDAGRSTELTPYYRPLTMLTFWVDGRTHGFTPFLVRLFNILLHMANTFLVYRLALLLVRNNIAALLAGLLFAVHPLNSEAVAFNSSRNTLLAVFFILSTYIVHSYCVRENKYSGAVFGSILFLCGMLSKEVTLGLVPFIAALEFSGKCGTGRRNLMPSFVRLLPYAISLVGYLILRSHALSHAGVTLDIIPGLGTRLLANIYIIPKYFLTVLFPVSLSPVYFIPENLHILALPLLAGWLCIFALAAWLITQGGPTTRLGCAWILIYWLPVSGLIPIPSAPLADRYLYLPAIGFWLIIADQVGRILRCRDVSRHFVVATFLLLSLLAALTCRRNLEWKDDVTLFSRLIEVYPDRAYGYHNLGCYYMDKLKDYDMAEKYFTKALQIDPRFPRLQTQVGYLMLQRGNFHGALDHYVQAIRLNPNDAEAHLNSGNALEQLRRFDEAIVSYRRFLEIPDTELSGFRPTVEAKIHLLSQQMR